MSDDKDRAGSDSPFANIAEWFFLIAGVVYGTGYMAVQTYLDAFGIHESAADSLKLRYMHVGLLCIIPPAIGVAFFYAWVLLRRSAKNAKREEGKPEKIAPGYPGAVLLLNVLFIYYFVIVFLPTGTVKDLFYWLLALFWGTLVLILLVNKFAPRLRPQLVSLANKLLSEAGKAIVKKRIRWVLKVSAMSDVDLMKLVIVLLVMIPFDRYCLRGHWLELWHVLWPSGFFYFVATFTIITLNGLFHFSSRDYPDLDGRRGTFAARISLIAPLCVFCVLAFARGVFPWIPTSKGGANLHDVPPGVLVLDDAMQKRFPELSSTNGVVVLEVSSDTIYVADYASYHAWENDQQKAPLERHTRPFVWNIDRKQILAIRYGTTDAKSSE